MNNIAVFTIYSPITTLVLSSNALNDLDNNIALEGPIQFNNTIVSDENYSHSSYDELHSVNSSSTNAKTTKKSKKPPSSDFSLTGSKSASSGSKITYTIKYKNILNKDVNLVITDDYSPGTVFIKADPEPDSGT